MRSMVTLYQHLKLFHSGKEIKEVPKIVSHLQDKKKGGQ